MSGCTVWYADGDGDGYGERSSCACVPDGLYTSALGGDCDDADPGLFPGAPELCDGVRNDCADGGWTTGSEDATASFEDATGARSDVSAALLGDETSPAAYTLPDAGTVWLCSGFWYASVEGPAGAGTARLVGRYGPDVTLVDAAGLDTVLRVEGAAVSVAVEGLTLKGGGALYGGGVYVTDATVELTDVVLDGNTASYGAGAYVEGGSLTLASVRVTANTAVSADSGSSSGGGGIYTIDGDLAASDSVFSGNTVESSGEHAGGGGVVYVDRTTASLRLDSVLFEYIEVLGAGNYAQGGGLYASSTGGGSMSLTDVQLVGNRADAAAFGVGGGLRMEIMGSASASVSDLLSSGNVLTGATRAYGGGVYLYDSSPAALVVDSSVVEDNALYAGIPAGGGWFISAEGAGPITLSSATITGNNDLNAAGTAELGEGGGMYVGLDGVAMGMDSATLYDNSSLNGDGIELVTWSGAQLTVTDSELTANGGYGVLYYPYDTTGLLMLDHTRITEHLYYGVYIIAVGGYVANAACAGDTTSDAGLYDNGAVGLGGACASAGGNCIFTATECDMGVEDTPLDNGSTDLWIDETVRDGWGDDATFSCVNDSCG